MKNRIIGFVLIFLAFAMNANSQTYDDVLKTIEENNKEIQAGRRLVESKYFDYRKDNLPEGPEISYGYFPDNSTTSGTKQVFEVSQSFQMPCYYRNHKAQSDLMINQEAIYQLIQKQNILGKAKYLLIEYVYLMKKNVIMDKRLKFAEDTYNAYLVRLEIGDADKLEVNKSRLHLVKVKKDKEEIWSNIIATREKLKALNGGTELEITIDGYPSDHLVEADSLFLDRLTRDPELLYSKKAVEISEKQIKVTKNLQLPEFSVGYGSETVANEEFRGVLVGLSIPLWKSNRAIQKAKIEYDYHNLNNLSFTETKMAEIKSMYLKAFTLQENLKTYETVLGSINSEELLKNSLGTGEISIIDFFTEMFYYYEVYDDYLTVERDYYQALANLYKYRL